MSSISAWRLKTLCNSVINMDPRVRFAGIINRNGRLIDGGMKKNVQSLLPSNKDDLFYLRTVSQLKELRDFRGDLGEVSYIFIKMEKISFVIMSLDKTDSILLISLEPDADPSFVVPSIKNILVE